MVHYLGRNVEEQLTLCMGVSKSTAATKYHTAQLAGGCKNRVVGWLWMLNYVKF